MQTTTIKQATKITLFLVHGSPNGLRTAEISNWSGKAIAAPRTEMSELLKRDELNSPGLYLLTGVDPDSGDKVIYIGESENVSSRLKSYTSEDYWNSVTVFVSKDKNLTKAHIRYLEGDLIKLANNLTNGLANDNSSYVIKNRSNSGAKLPESDEAEMDVFLKKCIQLLPVLGVTYFNQTVETSNDKEESLYIKVKGHTAEGKRTANGFVVFANSKAVLKHRPSSGKLIKEKREQLIEKGHLKQEGDCLVFTKNIEFDSPSMAGSIVGGGNINGLTDWKNSAGKSLKEIEADET